MSTKPGELQVVVQGQLFEAALPLVPVLLSALAGRLAPPARIRVADLLVEISCGQPDESELALGHTDLGRACRRAVRAGVWLIYAMLLDPDPQLRDRAIQIVYAVEEDRASLAFVLAQVADEDADADVRKAATELQQFMPRVIYDDDTQT